MAAREPQEPVEALSARALGAFLYLHATGAPVTADSLADAFKEGRGAFLTALRELRKLGLVITKRQMVNGRYVTHSYLNQKWEFSNGSPILELLLQQNKYITISNINNYMTNSSSSKQLYNLKNMPADAGEEFNKVLNIPVGGDVDNDYYEDQMRERERWKEERRKENEELRQSKFQKDVASKNKLDPAKRNVAASTTEFVERVQNMWHIQPWTQDKTTFKISFAKARDAHGTNGEIELKMMDAFFDSISHNTDFNNPDMVWKRFIKMFGALASQAKSTTVHGDKVDKEEVRVAKSMEKLFDV
jgi:tRNA(Ser,Leu) C12 N-acetylase TAN1